MPEREFNRVIDRYLSERTMDCEDYEALDWRQKDIIQCLKRAFKRNDRPQLGIPVRGEDE